MLSFLSEADRQFALVLVVIQAAITAGSVALAAYLALRSFRKQSALTRSRASAEKVLHALSDSIHQSGRLASRLASLDVRPQYIDKLRSIGIDVGEIDALAETGRADREVDLIENKKVRDQADWALSLIAELRQQTVTLRKNPTAITLDELLDDIGKVADYSEQAYNVIRCYLRNERFGKPSRPQVQLAFC